MRRIALALALSSATASVALAHPVRVGRYAEIPYGIDPAHPHPMVAGGPARAGRLRGRAPLERPDRIWERELSQRRPRGPTIGADGTLYFATDRGLVALDADGIERWAVGQWHLPAAPSLTPAGHVVAVSREGFVIDVTPEGVVHRTASLGEPVRGAPLVLDDGSVIVGTLASRVHRLDASLRRTAVTAVPESVTAALARTRRGGFAASAGRWLVLLSPDVRSLRQISLGVRASGHPAVADDGTVWVPTADGVLFAIDGRGRVRTRTELGARHYDDAGLAIGRDGAVRVPTNGGGVICVGPGGTPRWSAATDTVFMGPAAIDEDDTTLVVDRGARLYAFGADGAERWRLLLGAYTYDAPVLGANGTLYVSTERGVVQAWRRTDAE
ncbi:MAG: PQQ-binding-like beta-propeller repeat protein [Sandaracinaceae bacterium]|nr:PQQ-binding-like beta-propeller repeat protein [Sandaracinaceae bacterium]